jgi:hypothetical protein
MQVKVALATAHTAHTYPYSSIHYGAAFYCLRAKDWHDLLGSLRLLNQDSLLACI